MRTTDTSVNQEFAAELDRLIRQSGSTQRDLSDRAGVASSYISRLRRGQRKAPGVRVIRAIGEALEESVPGAVSRLLKAAGSAVLHEPQLMRTHTAAFLAGRLSDATGQASPRDQHPPERSRPDLEEQVNRDRPKSGRHVRPRIRIFLADDHALLRQALRVLLEAQNDLEIVGEATNGRDAVEGVERLMPDVVLMDMVMPGLNGIEATRQIVKRVRGTRVLILTAYLEDERLLQSLRAGVSGYVVKNSDLEELLLAIHTVHSGNTYFSTSVSEEISVDEVLLQARQPEGKTGYELLTNREREVLQLIAEGKSNFEIGPELSITIKTVEGHRSHIMTKLHAKNRTDLIRYAIRRGLVGLETPG